MKLRTKLYLFPISFALMVSIIMVGTLTVLQGGFASLNETVATGNQETRKELLHQYSVLTYTVAEAGVNPIYDLDVSQLKILLVNLQKNEAVVSGMFIDELGTVLTDGTDANQLLNFTSPAKLSSRSDSIL